ncbi:MAG TPA: type II toxin-antitoxin system VapC family toxin [Gaiella sp.]|nr:type II toxin-antitoxin system VapC family toxin [Gaiella sp.]
MASETRSRRRARASRPLDPGRDLIVVDSSAVVDLLAGGHARATWVAERIGGSEPLAAPHLVDVEVVGALRRLVTAGHVSSRDADRAVGDLVQFDLERYPHVDLIGRAWSLRKSLSMGDAIFVSLAEALDAPLLTTDGRLGRSHGHSATIIAP